MSFSPERQIKRVDNKGKIVALASVMAATAGFGALTLPKEAYGQEPTQEPIATDVVTGQTEPTPAPTEAPLPYLKIDPLTNECVAVVFQPKPEQIAPANVEPVAILQPDVTPAPTPIATELPTTGQAEPTPVVVAQEEPSEYTKEEVELFEDCAPDTEPVKTIIVYEETQPEVTPTPVPTPAPTLSPEDISKLSEQLSVKIFLKQKDKAISEEDFLKILENSAPKVAEYYKKNGIGFYTPEELIKDESDYYNSFKKNWSMEVAGHKIATKAVYNLKYAQEAFEQGNYEMSGIFKDRAQAFIRIGKSKVDFKKSPTELDKTFIILADGIGLK